MTSICPVRRHHRQKLCLSLLLHAWSATVTAKSCTLIDCCEIVYAVIFVPWISGGAWLVPYCAEMCS